MIFKTVTVFLISTLISQGDIIYVKPGYKEFYTLKANGKLFVSNVRIGQWKQQSDTLIFDFKSKKLSDEKYKVLTSHYFETLIPLTKNHNEYLEMMEKFNEYEYCDIAEINAVDSAIEGIGLEYPLEHPRSQCYLEYFDRSGVLIRARNAYDK